MTPDERLQKAALRAVELVSTMHPKLSPEEVENIALKTLTFVASEGNTSEASIARSALDRLLEDE